MDGEESMDIIKDREERMDWFNDASGKVGEERMVRLKNWEEMWKRLKDFNKGTVISRVISTIWSSLHPHLQIKLRLYLKNRLGVCVHMVWGCACSLCIVCLQDFQILPNLILGLQWLGPAPKSSMCLCVRLSVHTFFYSSVCLFNSYLAVIDRLRARGSISWVRRNTL